MYQAAYKCRLCGELFFDEDIKSENVGNFKITNILSQTKQNLIPNNPNEADLHTLHKCRDDSFGFADFQGFKKM